MIKHQHFLKIQFPAVGEPYPAYPYINIFRFFKGICNFSGYKSLDRRNGKYDQQNDEKQQQGEQRFTQYFPEFFDRFLCYNFANNINNFQA